MTTHGARAPDPEAGDGDDWPAFLPRATRDYLAHVEGGLTLREIAREAGVAPSTIMRRVRRVESQRDDPLLDAGLKGIAVAAAEDRAAQGLTRDAVPTLRRLAEPGAVLAVARDMEKGVVVRDSPGAEATRLGVVERALAEAMALRGWIACADPAARVSRYRITAQGRAELRRHSAPEAGGFAGGLAEARADFAPAPPAGPGTDGRLRHMRSFMAETPLQGLARRRDASGAPFLPRDLVAAGERLREDFELSQIGLVPSWEMVVEAARGPDAGVPAAARAARTRLLAAIDELGPGLADVSVSCCCLLEGLEALERRLSWSARSGKVVLRIALERLARHHREARGDHMIG
jgi:hypothetical protein